MRDSRAQVCPAAVLCRCIRVVLRDTIVDSIKSFYEVLIQLLVQDIKHGLIARVFHFLLDELLAIVLVDQTRRAELSLVLRRECLHESTLVVVVSLLCIVVYTSNIDNDVAFIQLGRVARADEA